MWRKLAMWMLFALLLALIPQTASAQDNLNWTTQFFNNGYLIGDVVATRTDSAVAFNWGTGAPAANVNADNFSARVSTDAYFAPGTYRFWVLADDGVRLWVNFQNVLDTYNAPQPGQQLSADVTLTGGTTHIQIDYHEEWGSAYLYLTWANVATGATSPNFPVAQVVPTPGIWTAQYFSNATLSGWPALIQSESAPLSRNWGDGSPASVIPADNFSARYTAQIALNAGTYRASVSVDDGARVLVDGVLWIDAWHGATGYTYTFDGYLNYGTHTITVEFYEAGGLAYLNFDLSPISAPPVTPIITPATAGATATVTAAVLNVRQSPTCDCGVLTKVRAGEVYPVVGRNADASWWEIVANNVTGWVFANFVQTSNAAAVPVTDPSTTPQPPLTGYQVQAQATLALRSHPGNSHAYLARLPRGAWADVVGRNAASTWLQVRYSGVTGWVSATYAPLPAGTDLNRIPVGY